jgi:hypothetical protein
LVTSTVSSTSCFSSLFIKELILKPDEDFGLDKGFEAVLIVISADGSAVTCGFTTTSSFFCST